MSRSSPQPGYKLYPLGRGWRVLRTVIRGQFTRSRLVVSRWLDYAASLRYLASLEFWPLRYPAWLATAGIFAAGGLQYLPHAVLALLFLLLYPLILLVWLVIDLLSLFVLTTIQVSSDVLCDISYRCPACYKGMAMPAHLCSTCNIEHTLLRPSLYGVLLRRCKGCETYLPTLDLLGRRRLRRICPHCHVSLNKEFGRGPAIHIALLGAPLAGKTTYLTSTMQALKQRASRQLKVTLPDAEQDTLEQEALLPANYQQVSPDTSISPQARLALIQSARTWLPRCLYFYDPPGEALKSDGHASRQEYYTYSNGIIFVIDPFAIPAYFQQYRREIEEAHLHCHPDPLEVMHVYERMMRTLEISSALSQKKRSPQSVAVVLTKVDALNKNNGSFAPVTNKRALQEKKASSGKQKKGEVQQADHDQVREFLCTYGLDNLVRDIEAHFAHVRYFSCSALEDRADQRKTDRLLTPLLWVLSRARGM